MIVGTVWQPIGPSPLAQGGRPDNGLTSAIAVHPNNPNTIYIGTAGGGVWRSRDAGVTWTPVFDQQPALGVGEPAAVAIDPSQAEHRLCGYQPQADPAGGRRSLPFARRWRELGPAGLALPARRLRGREPVHDP